MNPLVTVYCSTYNHRKFITRALDGFVMQQTNFPFEIIINDDASIDGTVDILKAYAAKHSNIILLLHEKNQWKEGMLSGKYFGFEPFVYNALPIAKGKYIAFCEGDDYWTDPLKLQKQVDYLESNPSDVMCWHAYTTQFNENLAGGFNDFNGKSYTGKELITVPSGIASATKMFRNLYNEETKEAFQSFSGDYLFTSYLGTFGGCGYVKGIGNSVYRVHQQGVWSGLDKQTKLIRYKEMVENLYNLHLKYGTPTSVAIRKTYLCNRDTFGIILPTYQRGDGKTPELLKRALNSIFAQTYKDFKIYLIGDKYENGSELSTIVSQYPQRQIYYENLSAAKEREKYAEGTRELWCSGGVNATNYALAKAEADKLQYICFIDHDDSWFPNHLQILRDVITKTNAKWMCTKANVNSVNFLPNVITEDALVEFLPLSEGLIKSSVCFDLQFIPTRFRDVLAETGQIFPADADLWKRMKTFIELYNLKSYYINTLTCNYISGGIRRPPTHLVNWKTGKATIKTNIKRLTWRDKMKMAAMQSV